MALETIRGILGWSSVINLGLLCWWLIFFIFAHGWLFRLHNRWFRLNLETFDSIHYIGIAFYKIAILIVNIVPYLAICIIS